MQTLTEKVWKLQPPQGIFDDTVILNLFPGISLNSKWELVKRAVKFGEILILKRGLYCLHQDYRQDKTLNPYGLIQKIYANSYLSFESALKFYNLIPDMVQTITCGTMQRSRDFATPVGFFSFTCIPARPFSNGLNKICLDDHLYFSIASKLRAISDLVYLRKEINWRQNGISFLTDSLRVEPDDLDQIDFDDFEDVYKSFTNIRVKEYIKNLKKELHP